MLDLEDHASFPSREIRARNSRIQPFERPSPRHVRAHTQITPPDSIYNGFVEEPIGGSVRAPTPAPRPPWGAQGRAGVGGVQSKTRGCKTRP